MRMRWLAQEARADIPSQNCCSLSNVYKTSNSMARMLMSHGSIMTTSKPFVSTCGGENQSDTSSCNSVDVMDVIEVIDVYMIPIV